MKGLIDVLFWILILPLYIFALATFGIAAWAVSRAWGRVKRALSW